MEGQNFEGWIQEVDKKITAELAHNRKVESIFREDDPNLKKAEMMEVSKADLDFMTKERQLVSQFISQNWALFTLTYKLLYNITQFNDDINHHNSVATFTSFDDGEVRIGRVMGGYYLESEDLEAIMNVIFGVNDLISEIESIDRE